jgi:hypothetical protein
VKTRAKNRAEKEHRAFTKAEWEKIHNACVRSEREPDEAQIALLEIVGEQQKEANG